MNLQEIKQAIDQGIRVHWANLMYDVIKDQHQQYMILCRQNGHCIGLTWLDGKTLNGKEEDFFVNPLPVENLGQYMPDTPR